MEAKRIQNPWVGPSSYQDPAKSDVKVKFCGRENETYDLMHLIDENFLVTLYGKSGNGKTSLLQAGVFPQLRREQYLPVMLRLGMIEEGKSFQSYIKEVIESEIAAISGRVEAVPVIDEQTDESAADHLWNYFARHHYCNKEGDTLFPVIVFDQFEEVLRSRENIKRTEALLSQLNYLIDESHALSDCLVNGEPYTYDFNFRFVISIREDELYRLEDCIDNIYQPSLKRCRYRLNALSREDAETIILTPGREYIKSIEPLAGSPVLNHMAFIRQGEVVNRIIDTATNKEDGFISPFMLSLICSELFKKAAAANAETPQITVAMIDQLGQNILRDFYLGIVKGLPEPDRIFLEDNLVDANRMRNSVNVGMMNTGCPAWHNLTEGTNRILQATNGKVELVHDQLALAVFEVREQRKEVERIKEIRRKNRRNMTVMSSVATLAIFVIGFMVWQVKKANDANWEMMENQSRAVAGKAMELINEGNLYDAISICLSVLPSDLDNPNRPYTSEAEASLRHACYNLFYENNNIIAHFKTESESRFYGITNDGSKIWIRSKWGERQVYIYDRYTGSLIQQIPFGNTPEEDSFSKDGLYFVTTNDYLTDEELEQVGHKIQVWNVCTGKLIKESISFSDEPSWVSFSPTEKYIQVVFHKRDNEDKWQCFQFLFNSKSNLQEFVRINSNCTKFIDSDRFLFTGNRTHLGLFDIEKMETIYDYTISNHIFSPWDFNDSLFVRMENIKNRDVLCVYDIYTGGCVSKYKLDKCDNIDALWFSAKREITYMQKLESNSEKAILRTIDVSSNKIKDTIITSSCNPIEYVSSSSKNYKIKRIDHSTIGLVQLHNTVDAKIVEEDNKISIPDYSDSLECLNKVCLLNSTALLYYSNGRYRFRTKGFDSEVDDYLPMEEIFILAVDGCVYIYNI